MPLNWHQKATVGYPLLCYGKKKKNPDTGAGVFRERLWTTPLQTYYMWEGQIW